MAIFAPKGQNSSGAAAPSAGLHAAPPTAPAPAPQSVDERKAAAAQALALAKSAMSLTGAKTAGKVQITETRRFAGKDIQVTRLVEEDSKEVKKAEQQKSLASSGLDKLLSDYDQKKKVSLLDKTRMDWDSFKKASSGDPLSLKLFFSTLDLLLLEQN